MDFVLNDENIVNSYGFVVLNEGGNLEQFRQYPVMLHNHNSDELIGRWDNLRVEGSRLLATPVFDGDDDFAKKIEGKVGRGFLRGASLGFHIKEAELRTMPDGSIVPAVTKWNLVEASVVSLPSNAGALRLYNSAGEALKDEQIQLSIKSILNNQNFIENQMEKEKVSLTAQALTVLGLSSDADSGALSAAVVALHTRAETAEKTLSEQKKAAATALVDKAIAEGRLSADKKDDFVKLATADLAQAQSIIEAIPARQTLADKIKQGDKTDLSATRADWDYKRWVKEDPQGLKRLRAENPQAFEELRSQLVGF